MDPFGQVKIQFLGLFEIEVSSRKSGETKFGSWRRCLRGSRRILVTKAVFCELTGKKKFCAAVVREIVDDIESRGGADVVGSTFDRHVARLSVERRSRFLQDVEDLRVQRRPRGLGLPDLRRPGGRLQVLQLHHVRAEPQVTLPLLLLV